MTKKPSDNRRGSENNPYYIAHGNPFFNRTLLSLKSLFLTPKSKGFGVPLVALAFALSYLRPVRLAEGGEITCLSMFILFLVGYFYGGLTGVIAALSFGGLKYLLDYCLLVSVPICNVPELFDYLLGYGLLGVGGFLWKKKGALFGGYLLAVSLRYIEGVWNCVYFYYRTDETLWQNILYGLVYCFGYIITEAVITLLILLIPSVREAVEYLRSIADHTADEEEDLDFF